MIKARKFNTDIELCDIESVLKFHLSSQYPLQQISFPIQGHGMPLLVSLDSVI